MSKYHIVQLIYHIGFTLILTTVISINFCSFGAAYVPPETSLLATGGHAISRVRISASATLYSLVQNLEYRKLHH